MHRESFDWVRELQNVSARLVNIVTSASGPRSTERNQTSIAIAYDVLVTPEQILVEIELPGVTKEDISLTMGGGKLNLTAERKEEERANTTVYRRTRRYGTMTAQFDLPADADIDYSHAVASFKDGLLTVSMPRKQVEPGISVPIQ